MSSPPYGYRTGPRDIRKVLLDSTTADISAGDALVEATAGYFKQASAGELPIAIAVDSADSPSADGGASIRADFSEQSVYEYPPDAGTVSQGLVGKSMDLGGPQSIDIDASADDIFHVLKVDTTKNTVWGRFTLTFPGVV